MDAHFGPKGPAIDEQGRHWTKLLTRYHWFVLLVAALGWVFDCLDQQLFTLARKPAIVELSGLSARDPQIEKFSGIATSIFLIGWATGGLAFGILGDRIGRAKTMLLTILIYSVFTGFSAFSHTVWDFALYRFLTGLGVGGEFAVGVALVAEVMPDRARPYALGMLQALSAFGNVAAAFISMGFGHLESSGRLVSYTLPGTHIGLSAWRMMFLVGTVPALLAILIRARLKEPEQWQLAKAHGSSEKLGSLTELFGNPRWRKRAIVGMLLASAGVIGLWGIGFFSIDFNRTVFRRFYEREAREAGEAGYDRNFVSSVVAHPDRLPEAEKTVAPNDLLSYETDAQSRNSDPKLIYEAALELHHRNESVSVQSVLGLLDMGDPAKEQKPQTSEERARRLAYLEAGATDSATLAVDANRIEARSKRINGDLTMWASITSVILNIGGFFGVWAFSRVTQIIGRRKAFAIGFIIAMLSTILVFGFLSDRTVTIGGNRLFIDVFWMIPLMGFCQLSVFGGYAIYFPELFPTRLRSTGTSFCYNVGRYVAASGPIGLGLLTSEVFQHKAEPFRWAGVAMSAIFLVGLAVLPFAPETKGQPLPE